jgi:ubiquitin C-terminal hydrolase
MTNNSQSISSKSQNLRFSHNNPDKDNHSFSHFTIKSRDSNYKREELHHILKKIQLNPSAKQNILLDIWDKDFLSFLQTSFSDFAESELISKLRQFPDLLLFLDDFILKMLLLNKKQFQASFDNTFLIRLYVFITKSEISMKNKEELHTGLQRILQSEIFSIKETATFLESFLKIIIKSCQLGPCQTNQNHLIGKSNSDPPLIKGDSFEVGDDPKIKTSFPSPLPDPYALNLPNKMSFLVLIKCLDIFYRKNKQDFHDLFKSKPYINLLDNIIDKIKLQLQSDSFQDESNNLLNLVMVIKKMFETQLISLREDAQEVTKKLIRLLLDSLFEIKQNDPQKYPLIKGYKARQVCFNLFLEICNQDSELTLIFLRELVLGYEDYWLESVANREGLLEFREPGKATGLRNLGNTCYVNSILQQFYFIDRFRDELFNLNPHEMSVKECRKHVTQSLQELQLLFARMSTSSLSAISPEKFCSSFRGMNNQPINPALQQDAYEFLNCFLDTVEEGFPIEKTHQIMSQFRGTMINEIQSLETEHPFSSRHPESFLTVLVDVKNCRNLSQALDRLVTKEIMEGDNALYREDLDKKVRVSRQSRFKALPETLTLVLKRFEYDQNTFQRIKLNNLFEFPLNLDLQPWTIDCNDSCNYELKGVVVHSGSAEYGHYYSHIHHDKKWFEFNDKRVREIFVNQNLLREEWFGGMPQVNMFTEINFDWPNNSSKNAYILFYQRTPTNEGVLGEDKVKLPKELQSKIQEENKRILGGMLFADNQFNRFCGSFSEILGRLDLKELLRIGSPEKVVSPKEGEVKENPTTIQVESEPSGNKESEKKILKQFLEKKMMRLYLKIYGFKYEKRDLLDDKAKSAIDQKTGECLFLINLKILIPIHYQGIRTS